MEGLIFDIQRFSIQDGPGIRTTIFMKGCPLRCIWCHNPESQCYKRELIFFSQRCKGCGACLKVCSENVHIFNPTRIVQFENCTLCGKCIKNCFYDALKIVGDWRTVDEVIEEVEKDRQFYLSSGGGVTISGGEPMMQPEYVLQLCKALKSNRYHVAIDTSGYCPWGVFEKILPYVDLILYDLKHMDSNIHQKLTGVSNELIIDNLSRLMAYGEKLDTRIRFPLIPGYNDEDNNLNSISEYVLKFGLRELDVIPYHPYGESKYTQLGRNYSLSKLHSPDEEYINKKIKIFQNYNIIVNLV